MMPPPPPPQQQQQQGRDGSQSSVTDTARVALLATSRGAADLPSNPTTATQAVQRERLEKGIAAVRPPMLRQSMLQTFVEMLQGAGPSFRLLQGAPPPFPPTPPITHKPPTLHCSAAPTPPTRAPPADSILRLRPADCHSC